MLQFQNIKTINELAKLGKKIILATTYVSHLVAKTLSFWR
ncbi:hypothetical protein, partial [Mycoplasmopsis bovis]